MFTRSEMDWVRRDKKMRRFPAAFELEMTFTFVGGGTNSGDSADTASTNAVVSVICDDAPSKITSLPGELLELATP